MDLTTAAILGAAVVLLGLGYYGAYRSQQRLQKLRDSGMLPPAGRESEADVDRLLLHGQKIEAIKVYRALHHVGLKEAKEAVEKREGELGRR